MLKITVFLLMMLAASCSSSNFHKIDKGPHLDDTEEEQSFFQLRSSRNNNLK